MSAFRVWIARSRRRFWTARTTHVLTPKPREGTSTSRLTWSKPKGDSSMNTTLTQEPISKLKQPKPPSISGTQSQPGFESEQGTNHKAWVAKEAKQPMVLETVDLVPLGAEDVEVAV